MKYVIDFHKTYIKHVEAGKEGEEVAALFQSLESHGVEFKIYVDEAEGFRYVFDLDEYADDEPDIIDALQYYSDILYIDAEAYDIHRHLISKEAENHGVSIVWKPFKLKRIKSELVTYSMAELIEAATVEISEAEAEEFRQSSEDYGGLWIGDVNAESCIEALTGGGFAYTELWRLVVPTARNLGYTPYTLYYDGDMYYLTTREI